MKQHTYILLFLILLIVDLWQVDIGGAFRWISKSVLMISLICWYFLHYQQISQDRKKVVFGLGLIAALIGDILLLNDEHFLYGLGSFLVMQILYSIAFWHEHVWRKSLFIYGAILSVLVLFMAISLWDRLGDLLIPVIVYTSAIAWMAFSAISRNPSLKKYSWVVLGTILFMISDSAIAIGKFASDWITLPSITVMLTYGIAQLLIVIGYIAPSTKRS